MIQPKVLSDRIDSLKVTLTLLRLKRVLLLVDKATRYQDANTVKVILDMVISGEVGLDYATGTILEDTPYLYARQNFLTDFLTEEIGIGVGIGSVRKLRTLPFTLELLKVTYDQLPEPLQKVLEMCEITNGYVHIPLTLGGKSHADKQ